MKLWKTDPAKEDGHQEYIFHCPGCGHGHSFVTQWGGRRKADAEARGWRMPVWTFNGDMEKPTFSPSLLYHGDPARGVPLCHLFLKDGMLQFLSDCTHKLAGQTVPLPNDP